MMKIKKLYDTIFKSHRWNGRLPDHNAKESMIERVDMELITPYDFFIGFRPTDTILIWKDDDCLYYVNYWTFLETIHSLPDFRSALGTLPAADLINLVLL